MVYTHKTYKKKIADDIAFEKDYLVECITNPKWHPDSEVIEYCERLARSLNEMTFLEGLEEKYGEENL